MGNWIGLNDQFALKKVGLRQDQWHICAQYACKVAQLSVEVIDEVLHDLPDAIDLGQKQAANLLKNVNAFCQAGDNTEKQ